MNYYFCNTQGQIERLTIVENFVDNTVDIYKLPSPAPQYIDQTNVNVNILSPYATQPPSVAAEEKPKPNVPNQPQVGI